MKRSILLVITLAIFLLTASKVFADTNDLIITGNGANSTNNLNLSNNQPDTTSQQSNNVQLQNDIKAKADTGNNTAFGNTGNSIIQTGDAKVVVNVNNQLNNNGATVNNCCNNSPTPSPTPTPAPSPSSGGIGGGGASNSSGGGTGGGNSGSPSVLGLSNTAGNDNETLLFYFSGLLCLSLGAALLRAKSPAI